MARTAVYGPLYKIQSENAGTFTIDKDTDGTWYATLRLNNNRNGVMGIGRSFSAAIEDLMKNVESND